MKRAHWLQSHPSGPSVGEYLPPTLPIPVVVTVTLVSRASGIAWTHGRHVSLSNTGSQVDAAHVMTNNISNEHE